MKSKGLFYLIFSFLIASVAYSEKGIKNLASIKRSSFPKDFVFGTASSAYQYEGAAFNGGKGPSIWDTFTEKFPDKIKDRSNGTIADDSYHKYKEDVAIMKDIGFNVYRFSISWPRLLPRGHLSGGVNQEGIDYYNNLINELLSKGIQPFVTLFHWDVPQALEDEYSGFLSAKIANDFRDYADLCYSKFGDRVKHWITLNEPLTFAAAGYTSGSFAPGRCSHWVSPNCVAGDSSTEPYLVGHNQLLAHAAAVKVYRDKYQACQKGQIGITLNSAWFIPFNESNDQDSAAAARALAFQYDWFMEPLKSGSYPGYMVSHVGQRLPQFSQEQTLMVKGSYDFIGVNYYTSNYATDIPCKTQDFSYGFDSCVKTSTQRNGVFIGAKSGSSWLFVYPKGIQELLLYTKNKFNDPVIYITENGVSELDTGSVSLEDDLRVNYINDHLASIQNAMASGVKVKGYFVWSLLDNFEWTAGYTVRFGVVYVDYKDGLKRYPKKSAKWFKEFLLSAGNQNQKQEDISDKDL